MIRWMAGCSSLGRFDRSRTDSNKAKNRRVRGVLVITEGKVRRAFAVDLPVIDTRQ